MSNLSTLRGYVRDELSETTAGRWSDTQLNSWLNRGVRYLANVFLDASCWDLLSKLSRKVEYTLTANQDEYSVFDIIVSNDYYGFIKAMWGDYQCQKISIEEYHRALDSGEYNASTDNPFIMFYGNDMTTYKVAFTSGDREPNVDDMVKGATSLATAYVSMTPTVTSGSWTLGTAAGTLWLRDKTGTFQSENLDLYPSNITSKVDTDFATIGSDLTAEDHGQCPIIILKPTPTAADTLTFWWARPPVDMSAATDLPYLPENCDELLVLYAAARAWKANRNFEMHAAMWQELQNEIKTLIQKYSEPVVYGLPDMRVS